MKWLESYLSGGFTFAEHEAVLEHRIKFLNAILMILVLATLFFELLHFLEVHDLGRQIGFEIAYTLFCMILIAVLRRSKTFLIPISVTLLVATWFLFSMTFYYVIHDEFRAVWFLLLIVVSYTLFGNSMGIIVTAASMGSVLLIFLTSQTNISPIAFQTILLSFLIGSLLSYSSTKKFDSYERKLQAQNKELERLASQDGLTNIYNRLTFQALAEKSFAQAKRNEWVLCYMMIDIDLFKNINDTYGHHVGDTVLKQCVDIMQNQLRSSDIIGRIGGEEFGIVLLQTPKHEALSLALRIRDAVAKSLFSYEGTPIAVTISIGLAALKEEDTILSDIEKRADKALYAVKNGGRNSVLCQD